MRRIHGVWLLVFAGAFLSVALSGKTGPAPAWVYFGFAFLAAFAGLVKIFHRPR
jgi:hypothetical protein